MNIEVELAKYIANIRYEHLPRDVVNSTKNCIIDTLGVAIAGSSYSVCDSLVNQVKSWAGKEESTIWVYGGKVPCQNAAMVNGTMARSLDFGGVYEKAATHPNETIIPAALALAERGKISGKDLIAAVTVGIDLTCRLRLALKRGRGFVGESVFGASAAASKILNLDEGATLNALGISFCFAAGTYQMVLENASYMHVSHGMRASTGILSGILAQQGVTGPKNFLEGKYGLYSVYENKEDCELDELTRGLGEHFESSNISIKPYPACRFTHSAIYGALALIEENHVEPQDIDEITVGVNQLAYELNCVPEDKKIKPQQPIEAQFSIPYLIGAAVVKRDVFIEHVTDNQVLENSAILEVAQKVKCYIDRDMEKTYTINGSMGAKVEIKIKGGEKLEKSVSAALGHPDNPLSLAQVAEKFRKCWLYAAGSLPQGNIDKTIETLSILEQIRDISPLSDLIVRTECP